MIRDGLDALERRDPLAPLGQLLIELDEIGLEVLLVVRGVFRVDPGQPRRDVARVMSAPSSGSRL